MRFETWGGGARWRRRLSIIVVGATVALTVGLGQAAAARSRANGSGGQTIASAPELPIGQQIVSGANPVGNNVGLEYWKVLLQAGDHLTVDIGTTNGENVRLCLLAPSVTDYTRGDGPDCLAPLLSVDDKGEFNFVAPEAGTYPIEIIGYCCADGVLAYEMTAYLRHFTSARLTAPPLVRARGRVTYRGAIAGATSGLVRLRSRSLKHPAWKTFAVVPIKPNGSFSYTTHVAGTGTYRIQAIYPGDSSHLPCSKIVSFKVV